MADITDAAVANAAKLSGLADYAGSFRPLGGGEVNDTFMLECGKRNAVLRVSRFTETRMLHQEARALKLLDHDRIPKLIYFNEDNLIAGRLWIMESYVAGKMVKRISTEQYASLGGMLARVHAVRRDEETQNDPWRDLMFMCKNFGDAESILHHPDPTLRTLINRGYSYTRSTERRFSKIRKSLIHGDLSTNNLLIENDEVGIIDWEFSTFRDPMQDFSTIYYEDMELNGGNWRIRISDEQKEALFSGYRGGGGDIDEDRIRTWIVLDKLGAAIYLYWKLHQSGHDLAEAEKSRYQRDLDNLTSSLKRYLPS